MANHDHLKAIKTLGLIGLLSLTTLLAACPANDDTTDPQGSPTPGNEQTALTDPSPADSPITTQSVASSSANPQQKDQARQGIFVYGEGFQTFKACGGSEELWVIDTPKKALQTAFTEQQFMELEPVYVEVTGSIVPAPKDNDSFAADYEKALQVKTLKTLSPWMLRKNCFTTEVIATGTRPDWQLKVLKDGDVFFKSNEGEFPVVEVLAYKPPVQEGNQLKYSFGFRTPDEDRLNLTLTQEPCIYQDKNYSHLAQIKFRGTTYTGCGNR